MSVVTYKSPRITFQKSLNHQHHRFKNLRPLKKDTFFNRAQHKCAFLCHKTHKILSSYPSYRASDWPFGFDPVFGLTTFRVPRLSITFIFTIRHRLTAGWVSKFVKIYRIFNYTFTSYTLSKISRYTI